MNSKRIFDKSKKLLDKISDLNRFYKYESIRKKTAKKNILNLKQIRDIDSLFKPYHKVSTYSHSFYTEKTGRFSKNYIPDSLWYAYIEPFYNPRNLAKALDSKVLYERIFKDYIKHPNNIAYQINKFWVDNKFNPQTINSIVTSCKKYPNIFAKLAEDSAGGHGVSHFKIPEEINILKEYLETINSNLVLQAGIEQHPSMAYLNESSVNTIRVLSHLTLSGEIKIRSVVVRMGRNNSFVDNASSGGITVGVEINGNLKEVGYDTKGNKYSVHPDSNIKFSDVTIPDYSNLLNSIKKLHWQLPQFRLLSWDIAIDSVGTPVLIEVNMHSGQLDFHQLNNGPVFGEDTEDILKEVFKTKL